jgi:hypothetical protein
MMPWLARVFVPDAPELIVIAAFNSTSASNVTGTHCGVPVRGNIAPFG